MVKTNMRKMKLQWLKAAITALMTVRVKLFRKLELLCKRMMSSQELLNKRKERPGLESEWANLEGKRRRVVPQKELKRKELSLRNWEALVDRLMISMRGSVMGASRKKILNS